jgi:dUTP pyrophosphatase
MLSVFKCVPEAIIPTYGTASSACFDLYACLTKNSLVKSFVPFPCNPFGSSEFSRTFTIDDKLEFQLPSGARALVPTGLKFNIPPSHSLRLHPRSGLAFKSGITLSNCEGVIDEDYVEQVYVSIYNISPCSVTIRHGDRICQGELVKDVRANIKETFDEPKIKTDRKGGFGSTGV